MCFFIVRKVGRYSTFERRLAIVSLLRGQDVRLSCSQANTSDLSNIGSSLSVSYLSMSRYIYTFVDPHIHICIYMYVNRTIDQSMCQLIYIFIHIYIYIYTYIHGSGLIR